VAPGGLSTMATWLSLAETSHARYRLARYSDYHDYLKSVHVRYCLV